MENITFSGVRDADYESTALLGGAPLPIDYAEAEMAVNATSANGNHSAHAAHAVGYRINPIFKEEDSYEVAIKSNAFPSNIDIHPSFLRHMRVRDLRMGLDSYLDQIFTRSACGDHLDDIKIEVGKKIDHAVRELYELGLEKIGFMYDLAKNKFYAASHLDGDKRKSKLLEGRKLCVELKGSYVRNYNNAREEIRV